MPTELTLIVAATREMGIGLSGTLPWTGLKKEMAYFARVTKRLASPQQKCQNAVIMGRKTWDSIPEKFRPLPGRLNVVVSRSVPTVQEKVLDGEGKKKVVWAGSLEGALKYLQTPEQEKGEEGQGEEEAEKRRVFVIGGAEIYKAALRLKEARRILLTRVQRGFECDVFFPVKLTEEGAQGRAGGEWDGLCV
ncbi:dihydrofolate reductase-like domain-containing protein [Podospora australis]|uniref:Dihydrofolate reductase n=1 Tax=Podospora australis TaxID=1536484 RepID=A0AAN6WR94_9PEZI|nr:dihydrofolate reductase-like domain-containing protein [Podospora australis]